MLYLAGTALKRAGKLPGNVVVATVMSNLGLEQALARNDISLVRTPVGDKYVLEEMLRRGAAVGGEQSGHVIFADYATTGDGILTALRVFEILQRTGQTLDDLTHEVKTFPQKLVNVRVKQSVRSKNSSRTGGDAGGRTGISKIGPRCGPVLRDGTAGTGND